LYSDSTCKTLVDSKTTKIYKYVESSSNSGNNNSNNIFLKKIEVKKPEIEEIIIDDDTDDWSAVPAFLRRNKK
jgi:hypothetical protein